MLLPGVAKMAIDSLLVCGGIFYDWTSSLSFT